MSESKKADQMVIRVIDRCGGFHLITADRMSSGGDVTTFYDKSMGEIASFNSPIGVMAAENSTSLTAPYMVPGEVAMSAVQTVPRGLMVTAFAWSVVFVISVGVELYKLF